MPKGIPRKPADGLTKAGQPRQRDEGGGAPLTVGTEDDLLVKIGARIPQSQKAWLDAQEGGINATVRRLIAEEMKRAAETA